MTTDERIIEAYKAGTYLHVMEEQFIVSQDQIYAILDRHGVPRRAVPAWSHEEDKFIRDHWMTMSDAEMGAALGRSIHGVGSRRYKMRLSRSPGAAPDARRRPAPRADEVPAEDFRAPFVAKTLSAILGRPVYAQRNALGVALVSLSA